MDEVLEYISLNYIWFLIGAIIIVLAIIGHYAEKSNFGQGKSVNNPLPKKEDKKIELEQLTLKDLIDKNDKDKPIDELDPTNIKEIFSENSLEDTQENQTSLDNPKQEQDSESNLVDKNSNNNTDINYIDEVTEDLFSSNDSNQINSNVEKENETYNSNNIEKSSDSAKTKEDEFKDFDKEFDMIVPKKDIMNEGILEDIEDLSLDNTQVFNKEEIPDLDNIDLPEIRDVNLSENDIWK